MNNFTFFDFEVYPEWWCVVLSNEEENYPGGMYNNQFTDEDEIRIKSKMRVFESDTFDINEYKELKGICDNMIGCGYNIKGYDLQILYGVLKGYTTSQLYILSQSIIDDDLRMNSPIHSSLYNATKRPSTKVMKSYQDLMDDTTKGLKDKEASLGMDIRETTVPFNKRNLTRQEKDEIIFYCKHDVYALHVYYTTTKRSYIDTKIVLCNAFDIDKYVGYKNTNATLSCVVLDANRVHGTEIVDPTITIRNEKLDEYFRKWIPADIYNILLTKQLSTKIYGAKELKELAIHHIFENEYSIGDGGLHSVFELPGKNDGLYVESTDEYSMYNIDVSSCYTSVMIFCNSISRAVRNPEKLKEIYTRRIKLKFTPKSEWSKQDKDFVAAAKLILNTTYGAMGNKYLPIYDDYMRSKVCRVGQMILIALGSQIYTEVPGIKIIQNNTDGILVYAKRNDFDKIKKIVDDFSAISQFIFEIEEDSKLWQLDVNNYVAIHPNGEVKDKGAAFVTSIYQPGYNHCRPLSNYVVPAAQIAYYKSVAENNPINPVEYIYNDTRVDFFVTTCTKGGTYRDMVQYNKDSTVELGKVARVIAVTDDNLGIIKKRKYSGDEIISEATVPLCPPHPLIVNDNLNHYKIEKHKLINIKTGESWNIDYSYYVNLLGDVLDRTWYEMKNDKLEQTTKFNV